jgi:hypothetical protein
MTCKIFLIVFSFFLGCKPKTDDSEEKYAVRTDLSTDRTFFDLLNKPDAKLKVCLINEDPNTLVGEKYLDYLEENFKEGLYNWLSVAAQHPVWVGPSKPRLNFVRVSFNQYLNFLNQFQKSMNPQVIGEIEAFLSENPSSVEVAYDRLKKIAIDSGLQKQAAPSYKLGCQSAVSIYGFTSRSNAVEANELTGDLGDILFLMDDNLRKRVMNYFEVLSTANLPNEKAKEEARREYETVRNMMWDHAHANAEDPSLTIGMGNIYSELGYSIDVLEVFSGPRSFHGKWTMMHEIGHLFLLRDVYIEGKGPSALNRHPNALMGNHRKAQGTIQPDDRAGLFAVLDNLKAGKIERCAKGYKTLDNTMDSRSEGNQYCIPTSDFINQVDIREPEFAPQANSMSEFSAPTNYAPK